MLKELYNIEEKSIISVIGSGGKTSFIKTFAREVPNKKTLISSTTKFGLGEINYNYVYEKTLPPKLQSGLSLSFYRKDNENGKIIGYPAEYFENYVGEYDYILLECDGSRRKKIKAWADYEPVIPKNTTYTMGVINLKLLGHSITRENTHRYEIFMDRFSINENQIFTYDLFQQIINEELFKKSVGEKLLFINQIDNLEEKKICEKFLKRKLNVDKIVYGSLQNRVYWGGK